MKPPLKNIAQALDQWFQQQGRDYPWRRTTDPYAILVSEMMLQQTQISTVLDRGYYQRWMERFPDFSTLAAADESDVLRTWEGLGYYRRARFLQQLAKTVMTDHAGRFPDTFAEVRKLPGIGDYTAGAVLSFAHDLPVPIVDGNVARVFSRLFNDATPIDSNEGKKRLGDIASALLKHAVSPRRHNSAIMELGQTFCRTSTPDCKQCPVQIWCQADDPASLPVKGKRVAITEVTEKVFFLQSAAGVLLEQETGKRRTGLWKLPVLPESTKPTPLIHQSRYTITRYKVTLDVHEAPADDMSHSSTVRFIPLDELATLPMPSPYRRALDAVLSLKHFMLSA